METPPRVPYVSQEAPPVTIRPHLDFPRWALYALLVIGAIMAVGHVMQAVDSIAIKNESSILTIADPAAVKTHADILKLLDLLVDLSNEAKLDRKIEMAGRFMTPAAQEAMLPKLVAQIPEDTAAGRARKKDVIEAVTSTTKDFEKRQRFIQGVTGAPR